MEGGGERWEKCPTGIRGFDEITGGGLPRGRATLVCGDTGCGKSLMAVEFLARGAREHGEPGVLVAFEERAEDIRQNSASVGFDLGGLEKKKLIAITHIHIEAHTEEAGEYDLEGLFVRLKSAIESVGAKRVVLDTIENLFGGFKDTYVVRSEFRRLLEWLKGLGTTVVITGERGEGLLTRKGIEEYVSDCVILLDHRVSGQLATRRLRVVKYRGSSHGTNEYPFLIDGKGMMVVPVTSLRLDQQASEERVSSGVKELDEMLGGGGYYAGSTVMVSGGAGTGKTSLAASFLGEACERGERGMYFAFEESEQQIGRGMRSIGLNLGKWSKRGLLSFHCVRPYHQGLEMHLATIYRAVVEFDPQVVVVDPVTDLGAIGMEGEVRAMLTRLIDFLKSRRCTAVLTSLIEGERLGVPVASGISSLIDTWLELRDVESGAERNRAIYVRKSRGMAHSNQVREFLITSKGIRLVDVCVGPEGVLTGSARVSWEMQQRNQEVVRQRRIEALKKEMACRREITAARVAALEARLEGDRSRIETEFALAAEQEDFDRADLARMGGFRTRSGSGEKRG